MSEFADQTCRRNCWLVSALGGAVIAALLRWMALFSLGPAVFFGLMFLGLFGGFLIWAFCTGQGADAAPRLAPMPETAPAPVVQRTVEAVTPRPDPTAVAAPAAPVAAPMVPPVAEVKPAAPEQPKAKAQPAAPKPAAPKPAAPKAAVVKTAPAAKKAAAKPAKPDAVAKPAKSPRASGLDAAMDRTKDAAPASKAPELLLRPRGGTGDDLKQIKGVGPALEKLLNQIGVWHFDQIASWKARDIAHVDGLMVGFKGRITRDEWVKQARILARGGATEFSARVVKGDVY